jgi:hypothetical protein
LVIGTDSRDTGQTKVLRVSRKRTGTVFTSADLANKTFTFHSLNSGTGTDNSWLYGAGTTDGSGLSTFTSMIGPFGPEIPGSGGTSSVSSAGIVTIPDRPTWYGLMTDDKKVIFVIQSSGTNAYGFSVLTFTGQTYTQSDLAGTWNFTTIRNTLANPYWSYGVTSIDAAGIGTYLSFTDSAGGAIPADYTRVLSSSGVVTDPLNGTAHGQLSYNKDMSVRTQTTSGRYQITIGFR